MENWFLGTHFKTKAVPNIHMKNLRQPSVDSCFLFSIILIEVLYMQQTNIRAYLKTKYSCTISTKSKWKQDGQKQERTQQAYHSV